MQREEKEESKGGRKKGGGGLQECWIHTERGIEWGVTGETVGVGDTLRNAWKVSERSGTHWTDNPTHQITMASPSTLISALCLSQISSSSKQGPSPLNLFCPCFTKVLMVDEYIIL